MNTDHKWKSVPPNVPTVDSQFDEMNGLQRATESIRYNFLCFERWISSSGQFREWLRHNARIGVWMLVPALLVIPVVKLVLWQFSGLMSNHPIVSLILFLIVLRKSTALIKR